MITTVNVWGINQYNLYNGEYFEGWFAGTERIIMILNYLFVSIFNKKYK